MYRMKHYFRTALFFVFLVITGNSYSQGKNFPKNFIGLYAGIEWNSLSGLTGIAYERVLHREDRLALSVRGAWIFEHKYGNMQLLSKPNDGSVSQAMLMGSTQYFMGPRGIEQRGFFLLGALGAGARN